MRIFVTGASGWIGSAVVTELVANGHTVTGLARSDESAAKVEAAGATAVRGALDGDLTDLTDAARDADGVVHLAFRHDVAFTGDFPTAVASDLAAIEALGRGLEGTDKPLVIASGVAGLTPGEVLTESAEIGADVVGRVANEQAALALQERGVRAASVRFAPTVHGDGDTGFIAFMVAGDRAAGTAAYVGDGAARWPAVHRSDAARLVRLAVEGAPAGSILHAVAEEGVAVGDIAAAIGRGLGLETESVSVESAQERFGFIGAFMGMDLPASSRQTQDLLGWTPTGPTLVEDLDAGHYYRQPVTG